MPHRFQQQVAESIAEIRAYFEDLQAAGIGELRVPTVPSAEREKGPQGDTLELVQQRVIDCDRCPLCRSGGRVTGQGDPAAQLMVVTLTPTRTDLEHGQVLTGDSGRLYEAQLQAIGLHRQQIWTTAMVKCPMRGNPEPAKVDHCLHHLQQELALIQPTRLLVLGENAARLLLKITDDQPVRGRWHHLAGIDVRVSHHPLELLRDPHLKREAWEDLKALAKGTTDGR